MRIDKSPPGIYLPALVGKGYGTFWNYKGRYRVLKGSRASKKSKTTALNLICRMMEYPGANLLVLRKTYRSLKTSCFAELKWAISRLGVMEHWKAAESPLQLTYLPTGQKIYFHGLDDPMKLTSMTVDSGCLCWLWIEEAYEIAREADFDMIDESIRGEVPDGYFKQVTLTFNPWNDRHWMKRRFFDTPDENTLAMTTNYQCNEWLDEADRALFERMKTHNPRRYQVAGLGHWGVVEGLVYERWEEKEFEIAKMPGDREACFGLDFGYTNDPTALVCASVDTAQQILYVYDELYEKGLSNAQIYEAICNMGYAREYITANSAEPKSIDDLKARGLRITGARKWKKDSENFAIQYIQDLTIVIHPRCVNFLTEIGNYQWDKDRLGRPLNTPVKEGDHLMDALLYGVSRLLRGRRIKIPDRKAMNL